MKKWMIILAVAIVAIGTITIGSLYYKEAVEETAKEAIELSDKQHDGNRALGSSLKRFSADNNTNNNDSNENSNSEDTNNSQANGSGTNAQSGKTNNNSMPNTQQNNNQNQNDPVDNQDQDTDKPGSLTLSIGEIKQVYLRQFESLQDQESAKVQQMTREAKEDYEQLRAGNSQLTSSELQLKYIEKVNSLEDQADARFNQIYRELTAALTEHGHDQQEAEEFKVLYNALKEERRLDAINVILDN